VTAAFTTQALEITGETMWRPDEVDRALDFIERHGMTALVFHDSDILNRVTFPKRYFEPFSSWGAAPPRRGENVIYNSRAYLQSVTERCARRGIEFFLEVKELAFPDEILELTPDLVSDGRVCPTHPVWREFIDARYREVCADFPHVTGFIISVGSPEGRASLTARRCRCDRCTTTVDADWHRSIVAAVHGAVAPSGKRLVVREFSYTPQDQQAVIDALAQLPDDIEFCVKPYARDYYLPWPDNTALGALPGRRKWLEYDVHGQYFGWGILPCPVVADQHARFTSAASNGVTNTLLRTDWERINGLWCLDSFSEVNLATAVRLGREPATPPSIALADALKATGIADPALPAPEVASLAEDLLEIYPVVLGALYTQGYVYNVSSMIPSGIRHGWWHMAEQNDLSAWDPDSAGLLDVGKPEVVTRVLAEKDEALARFEKLYPRLRAWQASGSLRLPDPCHVGDVLAWSKNYLECFVYSGKVIVLVAALQQRGSLSLEEEGILRRDIESLDELTVRLRESLSRAAHRHQVRLLLDVERLERIVGEARAELTATAEAPA
jgi:hypothetical protein